MKQEHLMNISKDTIAELATAINANLQSLKVAPTFPLRGAVDRSGPGDGENTGRLPSPHLQNPIHLKA